MTIYLIIHGSSITRLHGTAKQCKEQIDSAKKNKYTILISIYNFHIKKWNYKMQKWDVVKFVSKHWRACSV